MRIITDDVGSYPPRKEPEFDDLLKQHDPDAVHLVVNTFEEKRRTGLALPSYPQHCDMMDPYIQLLENPDAWDEQPYVLKRALTAKPVLEALNDHYADHDDTPRIKVPLTGPVELAIAQAGPTPHRDVLLAIAETVKRFAESALTLDNLDVAAISIDEPSLGTNPNISIPREDLVDTLHHASNVDTDTQIHLHSPLYYVEAIEAGINAVGIETASDPTRADSVDPETLESHDAHLRAGISRTDSDAMAAEHRDRTGFDPWSEENGFLRVVQQDESPERIANRLKHLHQQFDDRLRYVGPDCGLGGFPTRESAKALLENTVKGVETFREKQR